MNTLDSREKELTPAEALEATIGYGLVSSTIRNGPRGTPGALVARMPERIRKALRELRAEDLQDVRAENTRNFG